MTTDLYNPDWYRATTLSERATLLHDINGSHSEMDANLAEYRLQQWSSQSPFELDGLFNQRLVADGLSQDQFLHALGQPMYILQSRFVHPPQWLTDLFNTFSPENSSSDDFSDEIKKQLSPAFLRLVMPFIEEGIKAIECGVQRLADRYSQLPFDPESIVQQVLPDLIQQLIPMLTKTLVLELHIARLQGKLAGETPQERFNSFFESLGQKDAALGLLQEYPVLARQVIVSIEQWKNCSLEFLQRLCADWEAIKETFSPTNPIGRLTNIKFGAGDKHRGGRSVMIIEFESGWKLVYKPRSLQMALHFQALLTWADLAFQTLTILNRDTHGWVNFIEPKNCESQVQVARFYERMGSYLALLYVLGANDFHSENLIASGEHPILVDLESLFVPNIDGNKSRQSTRLASKVMSRSVLRVGLLPERALSQKRVDVSGLGNEEGQLSPHEVPYWKDAKTDQMRLERTRMKLLGADNCPTIKEEAVNVLDYASQIVTGFTSMYKLLWKNRDQLLAQDGPLTAFMHAEVRVVLRDTQTYARILEESYHPDLLRDALDRDRFFDKLWLAVKPRPKLQQLIPSEERDLWKGDIPIFTTRPSSTDLWDSEGTPIVNFFDQSGMTQVRQNLQNLGDADLAQQLWFIEASFTALAAEAGEVHKPRHYLQAPNKFISSANLLSASQAIGDKLATSAIHGPDDVTWLGLNFVAEDHCQLEPTGDTLYDGIPGIALYLAYLGDMTGEAQYTKLAKRALQTIDTFINEPESILSIGAFEGWGGIIYLLTHLGVLWDQPELLTKAEGLVAQLPKLIEDDKGLDIISGAAGCIACLLALYKSKPTKTTLQVAVQCGEHLLETAQQMEVGIGWSFQEQTPLAGFSHGAGGMASALFSLAAVSGRDDFHQAALDALAYENTLFSAEHGNWADLRPREMGESNISRFMSAWCHGAPGIGLARLGSLTHLDNADIRAEIDVAIKTTLTQGFGINHSLCHGDLGNLELLLQASQVFDDAELHAQTYRIAAMILGSIEQHGWLCGVPMGVETPGLMTGLAGIGYGLLRLAAPERVPSVLTLEPPRW